MWTFLYGSVSPSEIIESRSCAWPMRRPERPFGSRYGALDMDSMPPATATSNSPERRAFAASITDRIPEPQTLWTVMHPVDGGSSAASGVRAAERTKTSFRKYVSRRPAPAHGPAKGAIVTGVDFAEGASYDHGNARPRGRFR